MTHDRNFEFQLKWNDTLSAAMAFNLTKFFASKTFRSFIS